MAGTEWGPNKVPLQNQKLLEVTRFSGGQLKDIEEKFTSKISESPELSRDGAVFFLTENNKDTKRMQLGLDVLNQLSVLGKNGSDIRSIIIRQDTNTVIKKDETESRPRSGQGGPHYYYEIDWTNPPAEKPIPEPVEPTPKAAETPFYPFKTAAQRKAEKPEWKKNRELLAEQERLEKAAKKEREEITDVIIDTVRERVDQSIKYDLIKVKTEIGGSVAIFYRAGILDNYARVDRQTGEFKKSSSPFALTEHMNSPYFRYLQFLADQTEGKESVYTPEQLKPEAYEDIYRRAFKMDMLKILNDPEKGVIFILQDDVFRIFSKPKYYEIDLEKNSVKSGDRERPINPHFAQFLKQKALAK